MKKEQIYNNLVVKLTVSIESNIDESHIVDLTDIEREGLLETIEKASKDLVTVRKMIKDKSVIKVKTIKPGIPHHKVKELVYKWLDTKELPDKSWGRTLYISPDGRVVYTKDLPDPSDDGYVKGFQIAFDIETNQMIARNCDNIYKSLSKRNFWEIRSKELFNRYFKID